jgi:hypothetical protein
MYIKISNQASCVNRLALEKLGLSTKRDDPNTIGQFGSGIKYAPIAAIRMGLEFVFCGNDEQGPYQLRYSVREENGIKCIVYDYGTYTKESSFTVDAGALSWEETFQIYREAISNAKDGGNWKRELVKKISQPKANEFSVYITASPDMMEIYNDHDSFFCDNHNLLYHDKKKQVKILEKKSPGVTRVYVKTVMAFEEETVDASLFDYEMNSMPLNEERRIKTTYLMENEIVNAIIACNETSIIDTILKYAFQSTFNCWEFNFYSRWEYAKVNPLYLDRFKVMFGDKAVIVPPSIIDVPDIEKVIKMRGYNPVFCQTVGLYKCFAENSKFPNATEIFGEAIIYNIDEDLSKSDVLLKAFDIAASFESGLRNMSKPIALFENSESSDIKGVTIGMDKDEDQRQILIEKTYSSNTPIADLVGTIIHEYDHLSTGITDLMSREFRNLADVRIGKLMTKMYKIMPLSICDGSIEIKVENLSTIGGLDYVIEYFEPFGCHFMRIGKMYFVLDSTERINSKSGVASVSEDGRKFVIEIGGNFTVKALEI